jgi:hypothetical protein
MRVSPRHFATQAWGVSVGGIGVPYAPHHAP